MEQPGKPTISLKPPRLPLPGHHTTWSSTPTWGIGYVFFVFLLSSGGLPLRSRVVPRSNRETSRGCYPDKGLVGRRGGVYIKRLAGGGYDMIREIKQNMFELALSRVAISLWAGHPVVGDQARGEDRLESIVRERDRSINRTGVGC